MFEEQHYLTESGNRYKVNQYGKILDGNNCEIPLVIIDGKPQVLLDWIYGKKYYCAAFVIIVGFKMVELPISLLKEVEPLYKDDDITSLNPNNLFYRFKSGPLEVPGISGFYYVPFYTDYAINRQGKLINLITRKEKKWSIIKPPKNNIKNITSGYSVCTITTRQLFTSRLQLHRVLGFVFNRYDNNLWDLVSNHKDGNPQNNSVDNLEWVTRTRNNLHAVENGLRPNSTRPVLMKDLRTGEIQRFASVTTCCRYLGKDSNEMIWWRLKYQPTRVYPDMRLFKYDDETPWPVINLNDIKIFRSGAKSDIIARNVFTGEKIIFSGSTEGNTLLNIDSDTITKHAREYMKRPIHGWNFRYLEDNIQWPNHTRRHLQIYEKYPVYPPNGVIARSIDEEIFFCNSKEAMEYFKCSKAFFFYRIKNNRFFNDKYLLSIFELEKNLGLPIE